MKKWIELHEINASQTTFKLDVDSIISYGNAQGATTHTKIRTLGGHEIIVKENKVELEFKMQNAK